MEVVGFRGHTEYKKINSILYLNAHLYFWLPDNNSCRKYAYLKIIVNRGYLIQNKLFFLYGLGLSDFSDFLHIVNI